jgi:nucleoside-diphosphate-sugar epimerase
MNIFLTGASGFIGSSVGVRLLAAGHNVRGLVRNPDKADAVRAIGIAPVIGTLDDAEVLSREAKAADAVINAASSDHRPAVEALIAALAGSGKILIHTSGTSIVGDEAMGEPSDRIFDDESEFTPAPEKMARVALDRRVLSASGIRATVLCNSLIYGHSLGLPDARSVQLPRLEAYARRTGKARYIGRGLNRWSTVHISDVAALYELALTKGEVGLFCFVENGEASFRDMADAIGETLGLGPAESLSPEAAIAEWGRAHAVFSLGSNSRVRGRRARTRLGWLPQHGSAVAWIRRELVRG